MKRIALPLIGTILSFAAVFTLGMSNANLQIVFYKYLLYLSAVGTCHFLRKLTFPYIDLRELIDRERGVDSLAMGIKDATVIAGIFAWYVFGPYVLVSAI